MPATDETRRVGIIMAGGAGERFWPVSRRLRPKQLLNLTDSGKCMLAEAVDRLSPLISPTDIYIATGEHLVKPMREATLGIPDENIIAEPCKRNTSGCLAYATAHILAKYATDQAGPASEAVQRGISVAVVTADHAIGDNEAFRKTVDMLLRAASEHGALCTIGVVPTRAETGFGYIQIPEKTMDVPYYEVTAFHEKPSAERAEAFVASGRYLWNSGMFFWTIRDFLSELDRVRPQLKTATIAMAEAMRSDDVDRVRAIFEGLDDISIDCALMEHARKVLVAPADFSWDDVGMWSALDRSHRHDDHGNVIVGNPVVIDCSNCVIYEDRADGEHMAVGIVGMSDVVVVVTSDAVLVVPKDRAQDVRTVVEELKRRGARQI